MDMALWFRVLVLVACLFPASVESMVRHYKFNLSKLSKENVQELTKYGEWWKSDVEAVIDEATKSGRAPNVSDAHTINGDTGPVSACSSQGGYNLPVQPGKTYMLRIINAALNEELFFQIAGHQLTVVEVDAAYVKPFKIDTIVIAPGQTTNVLVTTDRGSGKYLVAASPFMDAPIAVDNVTATATLHYSGTLASTTTTITIPPAQNATPVATNFGGDAMSLFCKDRSGELQIGLSRSREEGRDYREV
ncbi:MULTI-COPPER OXIDASE [Salix purpurea]|uniref:laccase n=1 Tax=Salix purpurea TaxID=77065 RepID=A0A9Q0VV45_SALPP|nr:MULTI-COPPER OXIDASE [Salix purpurea]